jgi:hypothetical protein
MMKKVEKESYLALPGGPRNHTFCSVTEKNVILGDLLELQFATPVSA